MTENRTCENCKHDEKTEMEWPCINCVNNARDHFEPYNESLTEYIKEVKEAMNNFGKTLSKEVEGTVRNAKATMKKVAEIVKESTEEDISRRKFEAVACKGRNRKGRWNK